MRNIKFFSILVIMLFIITIISVNSIADFDSDSTENDNEIPEGLWFIRGSFKLLDEDDEFIYLRVISVKLTGFGSGMMSYKLRFPVSIKISKPFYGILPTDKIFVPSFGFCKKWDYFDYDSNQKINVPSYDKIISDRYHIELDGYFDTAFHFFFIRNPLNNVTSFIMSIIKFDNADVNINYNELMDHGSGILLICLYRGLYDHDSSEDTLIMGGDSYYLKLFMF